MTTTTYDYDQTTWDGPSPFGQGFQLFNENGESFLDTNKANLLFLARFYFRPGDDIIQAIPTMLSLRKYVTWQFLNVDPIQYLPSNARLPTVQVSIPYVRINNGNIPCVVTIAGT